MKITQRNSDEVIKEAIRWNRQQRAQQTIKEILAQHKLEQQKIAQQKLEQQKIAQHRPKNRCERMGELLLFFEQA